MKKIRRSTDFSKGDLRNSTECELFPTDFQKSELAPLAALVVERFARDIEKGYGAIVQRCLCELPRAN